MIRILLLATSAAFLMCGCDAPTSGAIADRYVAAAEGLADSLEAVKDDESAEAAANKMSEFNREARELAEATKALPPTERSNLLAGRSIEIQRAQQRIRAAMPRMLNNPAYAKLLAERSRGFGS